MKQRIYINNEDGTFGRLTEFEDEEVDAYNRPYPGNGYRTSDNKIFVAYKIELKDNVLYIYVCKQFSSLLKGIKRITVERFFDGKCWGNHVCSPEMYLEGKKCRLSNGIEFIMGKILNEFDCSEHEYFTEHKIHGSTCII